MLIVQKIYTLKMSLFWDLHDLQVICISMGFVVPCFFSLKHVGSLVSMF